MVFKRYVEVGRVVLVSFGPDEGKLATIVDIIDQNKCLIDGPLGINGVGRKVVSYKRLALTDLKVEVERGAKTQAVHEAWTNSDTLAQWEKSSWAQKLARRKKRLALSDFGRFKAMLAKKQKAEIIAKHMES